MLSHNINGDDFKAYILKFQELKNQINKYVSNM